GISASSAVAARPAGLVEASRSPVGRQDSCPEAAFGSIGRGTQLNDRHGEFASSPLEPVPAKCTHFADKNMLLQIDPGALSYRRNGPVSTESALVSGSGARDRELQDLGRSLGPALLAGVERDELSDQLFKLARQRH